MSIYMRAPRATSCWKDTNHVRSGLELRLQEAAYEIPPSRSIFLEPISLHQKIWSERTISTVALGTGTAFVAGSAHSIHLPEARNKVRERTSSFPGLTTPRRRPLRYPPMSVQQAASSPSRYYLLSYPRTASNLLVKILNCNAQPNVSTGDYDGGYFFMKADDLLMEQPFRTKRVREWTPEERNQMRECYQKCYEDMKAWLASQSAQGHSVFVKEHTTFLATPDERECLLYGSQIQGTPLRSDDPAGRTWSEHNYTVVPDEFLQTWLPTFLIRHPALSFPSYYRTVVKLEGSEGAAADHFSAFMISVKWPRQLYDLYVQWRDKLPCEAKEVNIWPIVLDAEDVISSPETMVRYCQILKMDPEKMRFSWNKLTQDELSQVEQIQQVMRSTLLQSTGIIEGKAQNTIDIDEEAQKWEDEFGPAAAQHIAKLVREATPDYEYLRGNRLRVNP